MAQIILPYSATPSTPAASYGVIYPKADGLWYSKDAAGNEYCLSGAQTTGLVSINSAVATDIFGAAGATVSINNSTPVTTTSFTACISAQVGSAKRVIPVQNWSVTASANLVVDGATSGTFVMPAGAKLEVLASTTTLFHLTTISARGSWTPTAASFGGTGISVTGTYVKVANKYSYNIIVMGTGLTANAGASNVSLPVTSSLNSSGSVSNIGASPGGGSAVLGNVVYTAIAFTSTSQIIFTGDFYV